MKNLVKIILKNVKTIVLIILILVSCSSCSQTIQESQSVDKYVDGLKYKSIDDIKELIKKDTFYLNNLIDDIGTLDLTYSFSFSAASENASKEKKIISVPAFNLDHDLSEIENGFYLNSQTNILEQNFDTNRLRASVENSQIIEDFKEYESKIKYNFKKRFSSGKILSDQDINLVQIDSALVESVLEIPLEYEKFTINKSDKHIFYNNEKIEVERIGSNEVELAIPVKLNNKIIGFQAQNKDKNLMNSNSSSSFPTFSIRKDIVDAVTEINATLKKCLLEDNKEKIIKNLQQISKEQFDAKIDLVDFYHYYEQIVKEKKSTRKKTEEKGKKVLCVEKVKFMAEFDDTVESITFFVSTKSKIFSTEKIIKRPSFSEDLSEEQSLFNIFITDSLTNGIADKKGNIIIPEQKVRLSKSSNFYYFELIKGKYILNWLDVANKKLVALPHFSDYKFSINENIEVFYDNDGNLGVFKNKKDDVLNARYYSIFRFGGLIFGKTFRKPVVIYDMQFNKVINKNFTDCDILSSKYQLLKIQKDNKYGIMDNKLNIIIPTEYSSIEPFNQNESMFIIKKEHENKKLCGLVNYKGEAVTNLDYSLISNYVDQNNRTLASKDGKYGYLDEKGKVVIALKFDRAEIFLNGFAIIEMNGKNGFINKNGDTIIEPKFTHCNDFKAGYAFVFTENSYGIINKKGDFVMKVNKKVSHENLSQENYGKNTIYLIDNLKYDYKGNMLHN